MQDALARAGLGDDVAGLASSNLSSSGSSPWNVANWQATPQQIAFALLSTGGSSWAG
jgi:hypothetical protein